MKVNLIKSVMESVRESRTPIGISGRDLFKGHYPHSEHKVLVRKSDDSEWVVADYFDGWYKLLPNKEEYTQVISGALNPDDYSDAFEYGDENLFLDDMIDYFGYEDEDEALDRFWHGSFPTIEVEEDRLGREYEVTNKTIIVDGFEVNTK